MGRNREGIRRNLVLKLRNAGVSEADIAAKLKELEWSDIIKDSVKQENIGKTLVCKECGETFVAGTKQHLYCRKCMLHVTQRHKGTDLQEAHRKGDKKKLEKYGSKNNSSKIISAKKEKYGDDFAKQAYEKAKQTSKKRYGDEHYNNPEKRIETNLKKYGVTHVWSDELIHRKCIENTDFQKVVEKSKQTKKEKYGNENYVNPAKAMVTKLIRYGDPTFTNREKARETCKRKYNTSNWKKTEEARKLAQQQMLKQMADPQWYEKWHDALCSSPKLGMYKVFYGYDGIKFDSSWELMYYIYLKDNGTDFIYHPAPIKYKTADGKTRSYFPDFFTDHYVEIKGDHLLRDGFVCKPDGTKQVEKTLCMQENGVEILTQKDLKPAFDWVNSHYGEGFVNLFKASYRQYED